jgi:hypothetical protein
MTVFSKLGIQSKLLALVLAEQKAGAAAAAV